MAKSILSDGYAVTSKRVREDLLAAFKIQRPVFLWGPPGIGKSEVVAEVAAELGAHVIDLRMAQMEPTDLRGIPFYNRELNRMDWAPPIDLPDQELAAQYPLVVLFLDEMNSAPPAVQAAGYQLVLNRAVGKYRLPDNVVIVAAGNRESDRGVTYRMPLPLANRFIHIEMKVDFESWHEWAVARRVHRDVIAFLNFSKPDLYEFDSKSSSRAFATPRSWSFVSDILMADFSADTQHDLIAGAVGEGLAEKFRAHRRMAGKLPNPEDILSGKVTSMEIREPSACYSIGLGMCHELVIAGDRLKQCRDREQTKALRQEFNDQVDNFLAFCMNNFDTEMLCAVTRIALTTYDLYGIIDVLKLKNFQEFSTKYGKYLVVKI